MALQLAVAGKDIRRTNNVLKNDRSEPLDYDFYKQDDGFYMLNFKDIDYDDFKSIVILLKNNGINAIGGDKTPEEMEENKIIKLADLIKEQPGYNEEQPNRMESADDIISKLEDILIEWEKKEYKSDQERYENYYLDIEELVEDYNENNSIDKPDTDINERKIRKLIRKMLQQ